MKVRRALFWIILALFIGLSVWWTLYLPFDRESVYDAIPSNAVFIGEHEKVAERWEAIAKNPLTLCMLRSCGMGVEEVKKAVADPEVARSIRRYAARDTLIAYVPSLGQSGRPAWILASWTGSQGQILRLILTCGVLSDFRRLQTESGGQVWYTSMTKDRDGLKLSIVVVQGVLVGCLSQDPSAARYVADRIERHAPVIAELKQRLDSVETDNAPSGILDRGWLDWSWASGRPGAGKVQYALVSYGEHGSAGWIRGTVPLPQGPPLRDTVDVSELELLLGNTPDALFVIPRYYIEPFLSATNGAPALAIAERFLKDSATENGSVFISLSGGAYSGRVLGLRVPTVLTGVKGKNADTILDRVADSMDQVNRRYRLGLVPSRTVVQGRPAMTLGLSRNDLFARLRPEERPAFVLATNWLVLGSNVEMLGKIVGGRSDVGRARWSEGLGRASDATAYAWIDLETVHQAVKNALAVYTLWLLARSGEARIEGRDQLNNLSGWIDALRSLKTCRLWLKSDPVGFDLQFEFGAAQ